MGLIGCISTPTKLTSLFMFMWSGTEMSQSSGSSRFGWPEAVVSELLKSIGFPNWSGSAAKR